MRNPRQPALPLFAAEFAKVLHHEHPRKHEYPVVTDELRSMIWELVGASGDGDSIEGRGDGESELRVLGEENVWM